MKRGAILATILCVAGSLLPISSRADDAAWLKTLHRTYTGYTFGDGTIATLKYEERGAKKDNKPLFSSTMVRAGLAFREDTHEVEQNVDVSRGFTGKVFWYSDQSGFTGIVADASTGVTYARDLPVWSSSFTSIRQMVRIIARSSILTVTMSRRFAF